MALVRTRRLYLHKGDFRRSAWHRAGRAPPLPPAPEGLEFHWLDEAGWRSRPQAIVCDPALAAERFRGGGRCLVGTDERGETAHELWVLPTGTWTDWIQAVVEPPPGYALFAGAWTRPDHRQKLAMRYGGILAFSEVVRMGLHGMYAGIEHHQIVRRAERNARNGVFALVPDKVMVHQRFLGLSWHRTEPPPPGLVRACAEIVARYPEHFSPE